MSIANFTTFSCFQPSKILSSASPHHNKNNKFLPTAANSTPFSSNSWWTPLFGWSSDPDYIVTNKESVEEDQEMGRPRSKFSGCFTEEKAKELRKKMNETCNFHDIMYHSAIASRLASDVTRHQDL